MAYSSGNHAIKVMPGAAGDVKSFADWQREQQALRDAWQARHGATLGQPAPQTKRAQPARGPLDNPTARRYLLDVVSLRRDLKAARLTSQQIEQSTRHHTERIARLLGADLHATEAALAAMESN